MTHPEYDPQAVEAAAQQYWHDTRAFEVVEDPAREKFYCLSMLPYPSGALHMGHARNYTIGDVISRYQRMRGKNVLQPMGWDAFGLPAENAAIERNVAPATWTRSNIESMREGFRRMGFAYDWSREFATCDPDYYVHEQRMFTRLLRKGLAYRRNATINWDPVDQTVLANEQVIDGRGWRSGALVEQREIPQWFLKITDYAQELLDGLDDLPGWPESVKTMQRNWIGRSEGLEIDFEVAGEPTPLSVFTTRADTLMGVTFLSIAAGHPLATRAAADDPDIAAFIRECQQHGTATAELENLEKKGMPSGFEAIHPVSGERIPIWIANFVLMGYGTGAVMAVPAHDQRDWEFARQYDLPVRAVVVDHATSDAMAELAHDGATGTDAFSAALGGRPVDAYEPSAAAQVVQQFMTHIDEVGAFTPTGWLVNSGGLDGMDSETAIAALRGQLEDEGRARHRINFRLHDWGVSRQRYWGCPVPVIHCADCGAVPVPDDQLPVELPLDVQFSGVESPLKTHTQWLNTSCPECGGPAQRDTDTFDTFMESSWYYARYASPGADTQVDGRADYWLPVDQYIGGIEHAIMHLLYFRFYHRLMRDAGMLSSDEPATRLLCQGMVVADTFYRDHAGGAREWISPADVAIEQDEHFQVVAAIHKGDGGPVSIGGTEKMSKSRNNGVDPQVMVDRYGADTVRLFSMFAAPPDHSLEWSEAGVEGMSRFLKRLWRCAQQHAGGAPVVALDPAALDDAQKALRRQVHETIAKVTDDYERRHAFNTAIATQMELLNAVTRFDDDSPQGHAVRHEALQTLVLLMNPITPHICHALWQLLGNERGLVDAQPWPVADEAARVRQALTLAVQVNGRLRGTIEVAPDSSREAIEETALALPQVVSYIDGRDIRKVIVVPGRIVNVVV